MGHHSSDPEGLNQPPFNEKPLSEMMKKLLGEYPMGKMNADDEGALAFQVGVADGNVVIQFPKPVKWLGFPPQQAVNLAQLLIKHAKACSKDPIVISL